MGDTSDQSQGTKNPLYVATRAQLNFAENVPLALAIALLAELNGANRYVNTLHPALPDSHTVPKGLCVFCKSSVLTNV